MLLFTIGLLSGCANTEEGRGVSTTSADRSTQLVNEINAEGSRKIPVTETR